MEGQSNFSDSLYLCKSGSRRKGGEEVETDSKENLTLTLLALLSFMMKLGEILGRGTAKKHCQLLHSVAATKHEKGNLGCDSMFNVESQKALDLRAQT